MLLVVKGERNKMRRNRYRAKDFSNEITARSLLAARVQ